MKKILSFLLIFIVSQIATAQRGPIQPEYASFEPPNSTDMVSLATGDFTYTMPLIKVPGPGGGYTMALAYHAGIELNEESSWVGLGWSLNAGAINRTVNQYPDDVSGESLVHEAQSPGAHGYTMNIGVYSRYYDSEKGRGGRIGLGDVLSIGFGNEAGYTRMGVTTNFNTGKTTADPVAVVTSIVTVATFVAFPPLAGFTFAYVASSVAAAAIGEVAGAAVGNSMIGKEWDGNITNQNLVMSKWRSGGWLKRKHHYSYYYRGNKTDKMYGILYLGEADENNQYSYDPDPSVDTNWTPKIKWGVNDSAYAKTIKYAVSDVSYNADSEYPWSIRPTNLAYDNYMVLAPGISGNISPYRMDMGSVAFNQTELSSRTPGFILPQKDKVSYSIKEWLSSTSNLSFNYKTQFKYNSELSNAYKYHNGNSNLFDPHSNFAISKISADGYKPEYSFGTSSNMYTDSNFIEDNRADRTLINGKLATGKYIQYFTNKELEGLGIDPAINSIYQDHLTGSNRYDHRVSLPDNGIGGMVITNADGTSYHFTIPIYQTDEIYYSGSGSQSFYRRRNNNHVAITWLLTGITGPDYIDRNNNGTIDPNDWGYWVKMHYGKFADNYRFRSPYNDVEYNGSIYSDSKTDFLYKNSQVYYLNKIQTATHTALFIKSIKEDGRSHYNTYNGGTVGPSSSLKLDEVVIVSNKFADRLFRSSANGGLDLDYDDGNNAGLNNGDRLDSILDVSDIISLRTEIEAGQLRSVKFTYDYSLCKNSLNSFSSATSPPSSILGVGGKLTLNSVSVFGRNDVKLSPDFNFGYQENDPLQNPDYVPYKNDGWGMYESSGIDKRNGHLSVGDGDEWSLKEIATPIGSKILIDYERDNYLSVSDKPLVHNLITDHLNSYFSHTTDTLTLKFQTNLNIGDYISKGDAIDCDLVLISTNPSNGHKDYQTYKGSYLVLDVGSDSMNIGIAIDPRLIGYEYTGIKTDGMVSLNVLEKKGGDIRVKSIKVLDENNAASETRYIYTTDGNENSLTSGVCSMEPDYIHMGNTEDYPQYKYYDYPGPMVMYGKVTILNNYKNPNDYLSKEIYEFETPNLNMIEEHFLQADEDAWSNKFHKFYNINVEVKTSQLGLLKSITSLSEGFNYKKITYHYNSYDETIDFSQAGIGYFTEGSLLTERLWEDGANKVYYRNFQTLKAYVPTKMESFTIEEDGLSKTVTNTAWDFITGAVLETQYENSFGDRFWTRSVPAYTKYPQMGHILLNPSNKHMLSKSAGEYLYVEKEDYPGQWDVLSAQATVWSNQWNYREHNGTEWIWGSTYPNDAWRQKENFVWKAKTNPDGTYRTGTSTSDDFVYFNWANPSLNSQNWVSMGTIENYNHNSVAVQHRSPRNIFSAQRLNNSNEYSVLSASNAKYTEVAFSGAEDDIDTKGGKDYFNQEVIKGTGSEIETNLDNVHTGKKSLEVEHGVDWGFVYEVNNLSSNYDVNKKYQASVWVKNAVNPSVLPTSALYYIQFRNGTNILYQTTVRLNSSNAEKAGNWYKFTIDIPVHNGSNVNIASATHMAVQINCNQYAGDKIYLDDFRFYPLESSVVTSVYDNESGLKMAELDNFNIATKFTYDAAGRIVQTEREVLDRYSATGAGGFRTISENKYNYGRNL